MNRTFLNPSRKGVRYWFCDNQYCRLSSTKINKFNHKRSDLKEHVKELIRSVEHEDYKLDKKARERSAPKRLSVNPVRVFKEFVKKASFDFLGNKPNRRARIKIRSRVDSIRNKPLETKPSQIQNPFFVFPLNVSEDAQMVLRAPQFKDNLSICQQILNVLPYGYTLVIKEHPGHPGMLSHAPLKRLLSENNQAVFVSGRVSLSTLMKRAEALITVNSTAGFEALVNDIPVITLGEAFYRGTGLTYDVEYLFDLQEFLSRVSRDPKQTNRRENLKKVLENLIRETVPEPGYDKSQKNQNNSEIAARGIVKILENEY